jgi:hypothetical protein
LLFGSQLQHRVEFLPEHNAVAAARHQGLDEVVVGKFTEIRREFAAAGWTLQLLGDSPDAQWVLANMRGDGAPPNRCP